MALSAKLADENKEEFAPSGVVLWVKLKLGCYHEREEL